jgi:nicotinate-nucleotide adenylyltransferase
VKIGLMGGTFDPIHFGHLFIAEEARVRCHLERVLFFPNNMPAPILNKSTPSTGEVRLHLIELAIADNPHFQSSRVELDRPGPSFAVDTVAILQQEYSRGELHYIVGADSMNEIQKWHRADELFERCFFIAASRPGFDLQTAQQNLSPAQLERVMFLDVPGLHIASRDLRKRFREDLPTRYLLPESVRMEIEKLKLYR